MARALHIRAFTPVFAGYAAWALAAVLLAAPAGARAGGFDTCLAQTLKHEGSTYTNHPADPGGPTKHGITIADVRRFIRQDATWEDVRDLTRDQAVAIYDHYWLAVRGDELPAGVDCAVFDYGVHSGPSRAVRMLARALGLPEGDGTISDSTIAAVTAVDKPALIRTLHSERQDFLESLERFSVFGRGWSARVATQLQLSLRLAADADRDIWAWQCRPLYLEPLVRR